MPPEDQERLETCTAEIAEILYRNSNREGLDSLDVNAMLSLRCAYLNGQLAS